MNVEQAVINRIWSETLLDELSRFGVKHVCIAPGSRSTPLTLQAVNHQAFHIHTHFDERGLGFFALGLAKASKQAVAIIVTSGTAVANVLPAMAEAGLTGEKLIALTADRPLELIDCGANQAIDQSGIFSCHTTDQLALPSPSLSLPLSWLLTSVDQVMEKQKVQGGPVHINCPYPEPLYTDLPLDHHSDYRNSVSQWRQSDKPYCQSVNVSNGFPLPIEAIKAAKGVVLIGALDLEDAIAAKRLAEQLGWPVLADPQSGISSDWKHYDVWLQHKPLADKLAGCELIVQFGARFVSKRLNQWIKRQVGEKGSQYWLVSPQAKRLNPSHLPMTKFSASAKAWVEDVQQVLGHHSAQGWELELPPLVKKFDEHLHQTHPAKASELGLALAIAELGVEADLFIGNSLFVRLVDMFATLNENKVYTNRGASGIDGLLATAVGVFQANQNPGVAILGDTSLLYDLNSLALIKALSSPVVVFITNNDGGAIFDLLPVPEQQKKRFYQMPHGMDFSHAAKQFGLEYRLAHKMVAAVEAAKHHLELGQGALLIEIQTPADEASKMISKLVDDCGKI